MGTYFEKSGKLLRDMKTEIYSCLKTGEYESKINNHKCIVKILKNDYLTIWVTLGPYNNTIENIPMWAAATIVDNIIEDTKTK